MRLFLAILLTLSAHAQDWNFNSPSDTNNAVVAPGAFSEGWIDTLYGMGTNQGVWDLGQRGYIAVAASVPSNITATIHAEVVAWCDENIYPAPEVSVLGGTLTQSSRTYNSGRLGAWQTFTSVWTSNSPGETAVLVTQSNPQKSSVIDRISVWYGIPRPEAPAPSKNLKKLRAKKLQP